MVKYTVSTYIFNTFYIDCNTFYQVWLIIETIEINYLKFLTRIIQTLIVFVYLENFKEACCKRIEIESSARKPPKEQNNKRQRSSSEDSDFEGRYQ